MSMMKIPKIVLVIAPLLVLSVVFAKNRKAVNLMAKPSAMAARSHNLRRLTIVRCCGKKRCSDVTRKKLLTTALNKISAITNFKKPLNVTTTLKEVETTGQEIIDQTQFSTDEVTSQTQEELPSSADVMISDQSSTTSFENHLQTQPNSATEKLQTFILSDSTTAKLDAANETPGVSSQTPSLTVNAASVVPLSVSNPSIQENQGTITLVQTNALSLTTTTNSVASKSASVATTTTSVATTTTKLTTTRTTTKRTTTTTATTTTTPPPCNAKSNCQTFGQMASVKTPVASTIAGSAYTSCGRSYFAGSTSVSVSTAAAHCKAKQLSLLSIDTALEFQCLLDLFKTYIVNANPNFNNFWTSGANEGELCEDFKVYSWCSLNNTLLSSEFSPTRSPNSSFWSIATATNKTADRCLLFKFNRSTTESKGLQHLPCQRNVPYICEPPCQKPNCPLSCDPDDFLFDANQKLIDPLSYGFWTQSCGSKYLFGNSPMTWEENWNMCCRLGMAPVIFETYEEQFCLQNIVKSNGRLNFNYWTAGTRQGCDGQWSWCDSEGKIPPLNNGLKWERGQPDNKGGNEECVHLRFVLNDTGAILSDRNCTSRFVFLCEANPKDVEKPLCSQPTCPPVTPRDQSLFDVNQELINLYKYGGWVSACGRMYMFSKEKANYTFAWKTCNSIGLSLLSLDSPEKNKCLTKRIREYVLLIQSSGYWTSGTNANCREKFFWCSKGSNFAPKYVTWKSGEPSLEKGECVSVEINRNGTEELSVLAVSNCSEQRNFVCEGRQKGTELDGMQAECMATWDITQADVDLLFHGSRNYSQRIKCFMKCIGENRNLFFDGKIDPIQMLRLMEIATQDTPSAMDQGLNGYVQCSSITGNDECDLAAKTYDCGVEKIPNVTQQMVTVGKGSAVVFTPPIKCVPVLRSCVTADSVPCVANPALVNQLTTTNRTSMGSLIWTKAANKRIFVSPFTNNSNNIAPYQYCCSIGMKLIEFSNANDLNDFYYSTSSILTSNVAYLYISEVMALDYSTEVWCGTKTPLNASVYRYNYITMPKMDCLPTVYMLQRLDISTGTVYVLSLYGLNFSAAVLPAFACQ
ncbi:uncharacterized protein LOC132198857 [Neocloeon triangulifer]|uniref:uncharacterized protein LOC132198857 n=1 Tax=Neocloeon triangulifer TaxID=2078957 RepID=UPI00286ECD3C|nr:uncharacterized protein LOC132198857 [Neocloeon triangulifer]XP_059479105.1 uncharacterized protein LOC132198857 [Neocloeon triangulifer]